MKARENDVDSDQLDDMRAFIGKRYPQARRDLVLDVWQDEYPSVIRGESTCMRFEGELAYALHDHLYEAADDVLYLLGDAEDSIRIERGDIGDGRERLWFRFAETAD